MPLLDLDTMTLLYVNVTSNATVKTEPDDA
jgi:hypothetical protein